MNNRGFSLMELAMAVGLMAVMAGVVAAGGGMLNKCRIQREVDAVGNLRVAAQNYLSMKNLNYAGITIDGLKTAGLLPSGFDPAGANSFGGDYSLGSNAGDNARVDIALGKVPDAAAGELSSAFKAAAQSTAYNKDTKVWTATF